MPKHGGRIFPEFVDIARELVQVVRFRYAVLFVAATGPDPSRLSSKGPPQVGHGHPRQWTGETPGPSHRNRSLMSQFQAAPTIPLKTGTDGKEYVDYKSVEDLRRMMTPNGKIYTRKRLDASAREQRRVAQAIKRARYMALLPYTSATL